MTGNRFTNGLIAFTIFFFFSFLLQFFAEDGRYSFSANWPTHAMFGLGGFIAYVLIGASLKKTRKDV
ncbi:hypothetical protein [Alkalicoccobacillus porphyridii]|uniref:Uncharacterized protein n=1 Tax=Alkalicoccobacillus porphyridii TaxID=2597270 RepID=A0A554A2L2_9BACI|nr:hypothetical protein [Alkalicoccobacillus porphyridii]TSB47931.1 hypothetical protein FN960_05345 [Alkalicoccobacillus porphyridii]